MDDAGKNPDRPNVLLICCDHLRADWLSCNGHPVTMTPQIDTLAGEGLNFQRAVSECPVCVPARRILMTGMGPYGVHMNTNRDTQPFSEGPKLAEVMTRAGYQSFASGKMHTHPQRNRIGFEDVQLNEEGRKQGGLLKDDYEAFLDDHGYGHRAYTHGLGNNQYGMRISPLPEPYTTTHWTAQKAMEFIGRRDPTRPFFLYVSFDKPHPPITPPLEYYELYRDAAMPEPVCGTWVQRKRPQSIDTGAMRHSLAYWRDNPLLLQQTLRGFAAMITHIDSMVGVLLGTLREHALLDNTLIILTSDHGDNLFDHGFFAKTNFMRGSANIPFIVRPPRAWGQTHGARRDRVNTTAPVGLMDIMPTILDICGIPIPDNVEGQSVAPFLLHDDAAFRHISYGNCGPHYSVNDGRLKYTWFADDGLEFVFDQEADPHDRHDLAEDPAYREQSVHMRQLMLQWMEEHDDARANAAVFGGQAKRRAFAPSTSRSGWNNRGRH